MELFLAVEDGIGTPCCSREAFLRIMLPAKGVAELLPGDCAVASHPPWLLSYMNATAARAKAVRQLLTCWPGLHAQ
jgi:hypothetical protein